MANDPRDNRFFPLQKKDVAQLTSEELKELIDYCDNILQQKLPNKARRSWDKFRNELADKVDR
jgi:hypothetical protein